MSSRIFLDSSILVEWAKKTQPNLFNHFANDTQYSLCISQITLSEFIYYWLAVGSSKAPVTLKRDKGISDVLQTYDPTNTLSRLTWLESSSEIIPLHLYLMQQYNLLPNDALILATCKLHGITSLASYDNDVKIACVSEGIKLIQQIEDLN